MESQPQQERFHMQTIKDAEALIQRGAALHAATAHQRGEMSSLSFHSRPRSWWGRLLLRLCRRSHTNT